MPDMQNPRFCPFIARSCVGLRCMFNDVNSPDRNRACLFLRLFSESQFDVVAAFSQEFEKCGLERTVAEKSGTGH